MLRIGELRERITLDQREPASPPQDSAGQDQYEWVEYDTVWGKVRPSRGRELIAAGAPIAPFDAAFVIRWSPRMSAVNPLTFRVRHRERVYNIVSVADPDMADKTLEIYATTGENEG